MKNTRFKLGIVFLFVICNSIFFISLKPAHAQLGDLGINPLRLELGGRPLGMGGAFAGLADDVNAAFYNPGGLAWAKGASITMRDYENIAAVEAYPSGYGASLSLGVVTQRISDISIPAGEASSSSTVINISYGTKLTFIPALYKNPFFQRFGIGGSIKALMGQTLFRSGEIDRSATGWDVDLGALWRGGEWWSVGATLHNALPANTLGGGVIKWDIGGEEEGIPAVGKLAASARIIGDIGTPIFMEGKELLLGGELNFSRSRPALFRLGAEWNFEKSIYLRTGFMQQYRGREISSDINFGIGYRLREWGIDLAVFREPVRGMHYAAISLLYLPKEWIVIRSLDIERPAVMIEKPIEMISLQDNIVTYDDKIEVFGKVKPGVDVYINGLRASVDQDNTFKAVVPLRLKKNVILVEARYEGERKVWKYKVLRKARVRIAEEKKIEEAKERAKTKEELERLARKEKEIEEKKERVETLVTMGVIEITPEAEFALEAGITRGELSTWLVKAAEMRLPEVKKDLFADVPKEHPLAPYVKVVTDLKLLRPFPDGTFRPGAIVSKEEGEMVFARLGIAR